MQSVSDPVENNKEPLILPNLQKQPPRSLPNKVVEQKKTKKGERVTDVTEQHPLDINQTKGKRGKKKTHANTSQNSKNKEGLRQLDSKNHCQDQLIADVPKSIQEDQEETTQNELQSSEEGRREVSTESKSSCEENDFKDLIEVQESVKKLKEGSGAEVADKRSPSVPVSSVSSEIWERPTKETESLLQRSMRSRGASVIKVCPPNQYIVVIFCCIFMAVYFC